MLRTNHAAGLYCCTKGDWHRNQQALASRRDIKSEPSGILNFSRWNTGVPGRVGADIDMSACHLWTWAAKKKRLENREA